LKKSIELLSSKIPFKAQASTIFGTFEEAIRAEIFSAARLEGHGESLARAQAVSDKLHFGQNITPRLSDNRKVLEETYEVILQAVKEQRSITPAAEWLIDNFHIIRAQLQNIQDQLPPKYYRELPKLKAPPFAGLPRVYGIAWAFVAHTDSLFDPELLSRFLKAYQRVQPLTIGELWATSITLRIVLIENLRRLSARIMKSQIDRKVADEIANEVLSLGDGVPRTIAQIIESLDHRHFGISFYVQLLQRLHFQDPKVNPILEWIDRKLTEVNLHADTIVSLEHSSQTAANASVRNIITSFRLMSAFDWQDFFEDVSLVDQCLRQAHHYSQMDFATRDRYRHSLEQISLTSPLSQLEIAQKLIETSNAQKVDPGFLLLADGREEFERLVQSQKSIGQHLQRQYLKHATDFFLGALASFTILIYIFVNARLQGTEVSWVLYVLALIPAIEIAAALVNRLTVGLLSPQHLPRLNLERGIPQEYKTFVVIPTMVSKKQDIESQLEQLEIHYLSNPDGFVHFALLTDFKDSDTENHPEDEKLLKDMQLRLQKLNKKYPAQEDASDRFFILHRHRLYNSAEKKWMGWERKRGKLAELNRLLLGSQKTSHQSLDGRPVQVPLNVRYVITLDSDTKLPKGAVSNLVGTLAHPLNRADFENGKVVKGYGILQPRITTLLPAAHEVTLFQRLTSGPWGVDPYAVKVSDVYQDLFGESSYLGKGIYDVAVYEKALENRIPENTLLSHDLFESQFARCGYLSDIEFFEDAVSHVGVAAARNHRWTRGDWQLLPWILGRSGKCISAIGRWKMIENLRRSLYPTSLFLLINCALLSSRPEPWIAVIFYSLTMPALLSFFIDLLRHQPHLTWLQKIDQLVEDLSTNLQRITMSFILIPHDSWMNGDAIFRSLYRQFISHQHLLEWTTAAQVKEMSSLKLKSFLKSHFASQILNLIFFVITFMLSPNHRSQALCFFLIWGTAPLFAYYASRPRTQVVEKPLAPEDAQYLQLAARQIWYFFTSFVSAEDHFLPPDNFQETPDAVVAHRSSPTNFGLYILSIFAAHDFGWASVQNAAQKLSQTLETLQKLEKFKGHFYNWYETTDLRPLEPRYISSVDNGNLAGHLIAAAQACQDLIDKPFSRHLAKEGLHNSFKMFKEEFKPHHFSLVRELKELLLNSDQDSFYRSSFWNTVKEMLERLNAEVSTFGSKLSTEVQHAHQTLIHEVLQWSVEFEQLFLWRETVDRAPEHLSPEFDEIIANIRKHFPSHLSLSEFVKRAERQIRELEKYKQNLSGQISKQESATSMQSEFLVYVEKLMGHLVLSRKNSLDLILKIKTSRQLCYDLFYAMDFKLLFDPIRKLFAIGMRAREETLDASYYDLLASEARLLSFIAIAKGDVPVNHWFRLGRSLVPVDGGAALVSWSGSMFEYLMPAIVMLQPKGGLLEQSCQLIVKKQIEYGDEKSIPWGISESAYNQRDLHLTYQYSNFGVPNLALKRGLGAERVIAPYATMLAAMYDSLDATENLRRLEKLGARGRFGFYEAVDFTPTRLPEGESQAVVQAYMAHHQGMSLIAINNILKTSAMARRFHQEPMIQATELLLQERIPKNVGAIEAPSAAHAGTVRDSTAHLSRQYHAVQRMVPTTQLLSNGNYSVMLTSAGSGYSRSGPLAVTRWREDVTKDNWGTYFFLKDCLDQSVWSAAYQPTCVEGEHYEVSFGEDRARFTQEHNDISSELEIFVSPETQAEVRRLSLTNKGTRAREIEITSYCEIVLNTQAADLAHPAFSNLFVQTEYLKEISTLLATRRSRSTMDRPIWAAHVMATDNRASADVQYETNRLNFLGRDREIRDAQSIFSNQKLTNTVGSVLDPIFSLRTRVLLQPGVTAHLTFSTITGESREEVLIQAENFHHFEAHERASQLAWTQAQVKLHYLDINSEEAHLFQRLATRLLYLDSSLRPSAELIKRNHKDLTALWAHGISGDFPIILVRIDDLDDRAMIRQLLKCQEYLASKAFTADLVILNEKSHSYSQELQNALIEMAPNALPAPNSVRGKVFILRSDLLSAEDRLLIFSEARVTFSTRYGSLSDQVKRVQHGLSSGASRLLRQDGQAPLLPMPNLDFYNGTGGFSEDGKEYVTVFNNHLESTPAPWLNVIANSKFGFQVSAKGAGYTWAQNSRENQLTPWSNDPVVDPVGEAFYFYDHESGSLWSPTARPIQIEKATYIARHGQGYSHFEHLSHDIHSHLTQFVLCDKPVKVSHLKLINKTNRSRKISVYSYVEWVLGFSRGSSAPYTITEQDELTGAMFASNPRTPDYSGRISFASFLGGQDSLTGDRSEFIGRNGTLKAPAGIARSAHLSGRLGVAIDPCGAFQKEILIEANSEFEITFILGQATNKEHAKKIIIDLKAHEITNHLTNVVDEWNDILTTVQVETPQKSFDLIVNRWLLYQTLACRYYARSAFYQAGGAYGFRDQLQDMMALVVSRPQLAKEQILRAAARQFIEGDVQHWWHPSGKGVRTHFSDDLLWLPYVVNYYIKLTKDVGILDEQILFLEAPLLREDQEDAYITPHISPHAATLFEHCARAIDRSLKTGSHQLPLMGAGDWNDGMNHVGQHGKGESVWMAWFLSVNLRDSALWAEARGESDRAQKWLAHLKLLKDAVELEAWDGDWYRRAFYDDGTPLGSSANEECKIDSLAQTWAIISQVGDPARAAHAMQALNKYLVKPQEDIILLFTPPFDKTKNDPGYIKAYLPGVRENGGQYSHAAAWCVIAYAMMNDGKEALRLFDMLNPIHHALSPASVEKYKIEPYVMAADIYSQAPHTGRGGWSWYTGSSSWMYRSAVESILGFQVSANELTLNPKISPDWDGYKINYRYKKSRYVISVENRSRRTGAPILVSLDGQRCVFPIEMKDDGATHDVSVVL
jgi:cyclic beta-1,2-glucan synthetase